MSDARLDTILESYGAAPERWPREERTAILALLQHSEAARKRWVEAAALDVVMVPEPAPAPSADLMGRLKAIPLAEQRTRPQPKTRRPFGSALLSLRLPAAGALAGVMLAFLAGLAVPAPFGGDTAEPAMLAQQVAEDDGDIAGETDDGIQLVDSWPDETGFADEETDDFELVVLDLALD